MDDVKTGPCSAPSFYLISLQERSEQIFLDLERAAAADGSNRDFAAGVVGFNTLRVQHIHDVHLVGAGTDALEHGVGHVIVTSSSSLKTRSSLGGMTAQ